MLSAAVAPHNRLHPLLALAVALPILLGGFFVLGGPRPWLYPLSIVILLTLFGYGKAVLKVSLIAIPFIAIAAGLTWLGSGQERAEVHALRTYVFFLSSVVTLAIEPIDLVRALQQIRFPRVLCIGILITLRFFSVLAAETARIHQALKSRGVTLLSRPSLLFRAYLMPLILRVFSISDRLTLSLEIRAFELDGTASLYRRIPWTGRDFLFIFCLIGFIVGGSLYA